MATTGPAQNPPSKLQSFLTGMGSVLGLWPQLPAVPSHRSDMDAIAGDFRAVGQDISAALKAASLESRRDPFQP